jgi:hypothetical protein
MKRTKGYSPASNLFGFLVVLFVCWLQTTTVNPFAQVPPPARNAAQAATPTAPSIPPTATPAPAINPQPSSITTSDAILTAARDSIGERMWERHADLVQNGVYGCASAVSGVLQRAGITDADSALVSAMRKQLLARDGTLEILLKSPGDPYLDDREMEALLKPGDIIIGTMDALDDSNSGEAAHTAIYVSTQLVYSNSSDTGLWVEANTHELFDRFTYVAVLRLT